ncbi:MAG: BTAD domain-containing putative transcriptional regulator [Egibacteraceae bacterium]
MEFRILGPLEVVGAGGVVPVAGSRQRALLALLLLSANKVIPTDMLVEQLWEGSPPQGAWTTLRSHVARLRKALDRAGGAGKVALLARARGYVLECDPDQIDAIRFERLVAAGRQALAADEVALAATVLRKALELWRGPPLADFISPSWSRSEIARLEELRLTAIEDRVEADLSLGRHSQLVGELEAFVGEHPLRERLWLQLMLALYRGGRQAEALQAYQTIRSRLIDELGLAPGAALRRLEEDILLQRPELEWVRPEAGEPPGAASNLPVQLTSFVGRELDVREVRKLLETTRLVTLTGAGGCGKTRLAVEVAAGLAGELPDGAWFAALAALTDPGVVPGTVASALGVRQEPGRSPVDLLIDRLRARRLLLVLDNCEHLVAACAALVDRLLRACPQLRVLATSQEALGVPGEVAWHVPSLSSPQLGEASSLEQLLHYEAVRLFVDRAHAARPELLLSADDVPALIQVCAHLDGIPLAIELAAARVPVLTVRQIADRLGDRFRLLRTGSRTALPRHHTLRAAVEWSHDLLGPSERILFRRLSVFTGGFGLDAVEAVCAGDGVDDDEVLDLLARLVNKSVVSRADWKGVARYRLLETIRQYAWERLVEAGEDADVRTRHRDWCLRLAEDAQTRVFGVDGGTVLERLAVEHDNFSAALEWSAEGVDGQQVGLRMAQALYPLWWLGGHLHEGRAWMEMLSRRTGNADEEDARTAAVMGRVSHLTWRAGDLEGAVRLADQALALARRSGHRREVGKALKNVANLAMMRGELERAGLLLQESLAIAREVDDGALAASSLIWLGWVAQRQGRYSDARARAEEFRASSGGESWYNLTRALYLIGWLEFEQGDYPAARQRLHDARALAASSGDREYEVMALEALGTVVAAEGRHAEARAICEEALAYIQEFRQLFLVGIHAVLGVLVANEGDHTAAQRLLAEGTARARRLGDVFVLVGTLTRTGVASAAGGDGATARAAFQEALEISHRAGMPWPLAASLEGLAQLDAAGAEPERAARLLGAAERIRTTTGSVQPLSLQARHERAVDQTRAALGEAAFTAAFSAGRAMPLEDAVALGRS